MLGSGLWDVLLWCLELEAWMLIRRRGDGGDGHVAVAVGGEDGGALWVVLLVWISIVLGVLSKSIYCRCILVNCS